MTLYYNSAISANFTKNDCPSNYTPAAGSYSYTVNAGTHQSTISQSDADLKALNDLNTNGQINANNQGSCNEDRLGFRTIFRSSTCDNTGETLSRVWLHVTDLSGISLNSYSSSGIYAYANQYGDTKVAAGWYTDLYSDPGDGAYIRVFQVNSSGEIVSYSLCAIP